MPWDSSTQRMSRPINAADLNLAGGFAAGASVSDIILNGGWNKWAKYKWIRSSAVEYESQWDATNQKWKDTATWWKGSDGHCGMSFDVFTTLGDPDSSSSFLYKLRTGALVWTYLKPRSSNPTTERGRYMDLSEYWAGAPAPLEGVADTLALSNNTVTIDINMNRGDRTSLQLSDFAHNGTSLNNYYIGVFLYCAGVGYTYKTVGTVASATTRTTLNLTAAYGGKTATVALFLSSVPLTQGQSSVSGVFISADCAPQALQIRAEVPNYVTSMDTAMWKGAPLPYSGVDVVVQLKNNTAQATAATDIEIKLYQSGDSNYIGIYRVTGVTVPAKSGGEPGTYTISTPSRTGIVPSVPYDSTKTYHIELTSTSGIWSGQRDVDAPRT
jgi:hypothetical protein